MTTPRTDFNDLIDDNLVEILLQLDQAVSSPADLARLRMVSTRFDKLAGNPIYWKTKVAIHFREAYKRQLKNKDVNWLNVFKGEYKKQYKIDLNNHTTLSLHQRKLISAIKEGNLGVIKQLNPSLNDLISEVNDGQDTPIALCTKNRNILGGSRLSPGRRHAR